MIKTLSKLFFVMVIFGLGFCLPFSQVLCQPLSSSELINNPKVYDGKIVSFEGELIGDIMKRGAFSWININDGKNALGVWIKNSLLKDLVYSGSYQTQGDFVEVTGVFHHSCLEHGGDLDLHADAFRKISSGRSKVERMNADKVKLVVMLLGVLCLVLILSRLKRPQAKK